MANLATGLIKLGFIPRTDFHVVDDGSGQRVVWLRDDVQEPGLQAIITAAVTSELDQAADEARLAGIKASALRATLLGRLKAATAQDIDDFVEQRVTGTAAAQMIAVKQLLKMILLAIATDQRS